MSLSDSKPERESVHFFTEAGKVQARKLLLVPDPDYPKLSALKWLQKPREVSFNFRFRDLLQSAPEVIDQLTELMSSAVDQAAHDHQVEVEAIASPKFKAATIFSEPIAQTLGVPLVRFDGKNLRGASTAIVMQANTYAFIENYMSLGKNSFAAIKRLQEEFGCRVPFLIALVSWGLPSVNRYFSQELNTEVRSLATIPELRQDPNFTNDHDKLSLIDQEYQELLNRYP